ncbi:hypothetical protein QQS21_008354 [Conoideocrella luteorostrata]|uniref:Serine hydrolase domain-containing protein n=1 Tax=Conoideocrella luteorostrata TaxID=1105319 RepID=A0AAJ0CLT2_9HYPO|nr:hypothetical protein QQS21_008354 [Conoideocrella luteorostrata]
MTVSTTPTPTASQPSKQSDGKTDVKILMLHGFTQSGSIFRAKTRALEKLLTKVLSSISLTPQLIYPTGPNRLLPQDIPGYSPSKNGDDDDWQPDTWAWWRRDDNSGEYLYLEKGMATIAQTIREVGGIDGVCGFSQGGAATGIIAAALEPQREVPDGKAGEWVRELREANEGKALKFAVSYSGFWARPQSLKFLYEPNIKTPMMHYLGSLDTVVDEDRSQGLIDRCEHATTVVHPGGHHVPVSREWVMPLAGFIKDHAQESVPKAGL